MELSVNLDSVAVGWLVLARVSGFFLIAPVLGNRIVPAQIKIGLAVAVTIVLAQVVPMQGVAWNLPLLLWQTIGETGVGLALGLGARLVFEAAQAAGKLVGAQMEFGGATTYDPLSEHEYSKVDRTYSIMAILTFLAIGGHHLMLYGLADSFQKAPVGLAALSAVRMNSLVDLSAKMLPTAISLGLPMVAALLLVDLVLAVIGRTVPQLQVFILGQSLKLGVGLLVLSLALPAVIGAMAGLFQGVGQTSRLLLAGG